MAKPYLKKANWKSDFTDPSNAKIVLMGSISVMGLCGQYNAHMSLNFSKISVGNLPTFTVLFKKHIEKKGITKWAHGDFW